MKKKRMVLAGLLGLGLLGLTGFLSFRLGRQGSEEKSENETEISREAQVSFGSRSVVLDPCLDGAPCDFSSEAAPLWMVSAADRLLPELEKQEGIAGAAAFYRRYGGNIYHGMDGLFGGTILGVEDGFLSVSGFQVEKGRGITKRDVEERNPVALVDGRASQILFHGAEPIGETLEVEGRLYQVVGVIGLLEPQMGGGLVLVPESTWPEIYQYEEPKSVVIGLLEPPFGAAGEVGKKREREEAGNNAARILNSLAPEGENIRYQAQASEQDSSGH